MKNLLFILLLQLCSHNMYGQGFVDWSHETWNGSSVFDSGIGTTLWANDNEIQLTNLRRWYFYNNHIIGEYDTFINPEYKTAYFILDEINDDLKTYNNKELFEKDIQIIQLRPLLWTRWYYDHFTVIQLILVIFFLSWPIATSIFLFIGFLIFMSITLKKKLLKFIFILIILMLLVPVILLIINDYFTSSI